MSLLDNYIESLEIGQGHGNQGLEHVQLGYVSTGFGQREEAIFQIDEVQFQISSQIINMVVSNNILVVLLDTFQLLTIDLDNPIQVKETQITRKQIEINDVKLFLDPTGRHLIVATDGGENYYMYESWKQPKALSKLKGINITSVAWNKQSSLSSTSTFEVLIGTRDGAVYETWLEPNDDFFKKEDKYAQQIYTIEQYTPILGLYFEQFPVNTKKYVVIAITSTRIYQFIGTVGESIEVRGDCSLFEPLFASYETLPKCHEIPGALNYSQLHFFRRFHNLQQQSIAESFAWLTGSGIYHGTISFGSQDKNGSVISDPQLLQYPYLSEIIDSEMKLNKCPLTFALTEFHFILVYDDRIQSICRLNDQVVFEEVLPYRVIGMAIDNIKRTFWIYTSLYIYELCIQNEERDVWRIYLDKKQYNSALRYCKDPSQKDKVFKTQAKDYFHQKRFKMSAQIYANSTVPFEQVSLKFVDKTDALQVYLTNKLAHLTKQDRTQKIMITTWLTENYLSKMNELEDLASTAHCFPTPTEPTSLIPATGSYFMEQMEETKDEFNAFLEANTATLHHSTVYALLKSHNRHEEYIYFATLVCDYDVVIEYWISEKQWKNALEVLNKQTKHDLFYKYSPILMENEPHETVNVWMKQTNLNPRQLIPALLKYSRKSDELMGQNQAIRYLSNVVSSMNNTDPVIHNLLLSLYASQKTQDESALLTYLKNEGRDMHYQLDYALRLCTLHNRTQSSIHIYSQMGLYEEAVNLALKINDLELARINADKPDEPLRKYLWLRIAKHIICELKDTKHAVQFLNQSDVLKIEDILCYFPDFTVIDDLKEEICTTLEDYTISISNIRMDMKEAVKNSENIRFDLKELKNRFSIVNAADRCYCCDLILFTSEFYIFPCQHAFHRDCLYEKMSKILPSRDIKRIRSIQDTITQATQETPEPSSPGLINSAKQVIFSTDAEDVPQVEKEKSKKRLKKLQEELDDIICSECLLCGDAMIKSIDHPFVSEEEINAGSDWFL